MFGPSPPRKYTRLRRLTTSRSPCGPPGTAAQGSLPNDSNRRAIATEGMPSSSASSAIAASDLIACSNSSSHGTDNRPLFLCFRTLTIPSAFSPVLTRRCNRAQSLSIPGAIAWPPRSASIWDDEPIRVPAPCREGAPTPFVFPKAHGLPSLPSGSLRLASEQRLFRILRGQGDDDI